MNHLDHPTATTDAERIRAHLAQEGATIRDAHFAGATGDWVVQRRTELIDSTLRAMHGRLSMGAVLPALVAVGGFGRGELNPYSDIDLLLLCRDETDRKRSSDLLYPLWDAGLDVGYSVRTVKECVALARRDSKIRTSLVESRLIAGDAGLYDAFLEAMRSEVFYWRADSFISEKIAERSATRRSFGGSIYLREPNIKEGEGGLRDVHAAFWVAAARFRVTSLAELVTRGVVTAGHYAVFLRARNFLWRLRNELHYLSGRKNDHLTFDLQEQAAKDFRYRDSANLLAVERFMKTYFIHARTVREFSGMVLDAAVRKPRRGWFDRVQVLGCFSLVGRTIVAATDDVCRTDPAQILTAFEIVQSRHAFLSDRMQTMIRRCRIGDDVRTSPAAARSFLSILNNPDRLTETLTQMKDLRFLGRFLPEFRAVQSLARHDYYHLYTVDEHILLALRNLQNLWDGSYPGNPSLVDAFKGLQKRWVLVLATLLHDLGKVYRQDHDSAGAIIAGGVLARLGVAGEDRERVLFLVKNHLVMASVAQRRELTDRRVVEDFARLVGDRENLAMLYLLTYADIAAVHPHAWTQWKAVLLHDLFVRTRALFDASGAAVAADRERLAAAVAKIRETAAAGAVAPASLEWFLAVMSNQYILATPAARVVEHLAMVKRLETEPLVMRRRHSAGRGYTELVVCAYDAYGMFYRIAGAIASKNLNILRAQVYTSRDGVMIDTFQLTDAEGRLYDYEPAWESVLDELQTALVYKARLPEPGAASSGRTRYAPAVTPTVEFDNRSSDSFTIIDVTARDRVGFLYVVAKALFDLNLDVGSARIVTEGAQAMDSFYVTDLLRRKITEEARLEQIKKTLLTVLAE